MTAVPGNTPTRGARLLWRAAEGLLVVSFVYVTLVTLRDIRWGGNSWKQGDWLINNAGGEVRRGGFGSAVLSIADLIGTSPLVLVAALQIAMLAVLYLAFRHLAARLPDPRVAALILVSPAIFTVFWAADPQGSMRKEIIAFAGIALAAIGATQNRTMPLWAGTVLLCISFFAHEAMVLLAPAYLGVLLVSGMVRSAPRQVLVAAASVVGIASFALHHALTHARIADTAQVCAPLLARGLPQSICVGAIEWLEFDAARGHREMLVWMHPANVAGFVIAYALALAPFVYLSALSRRPARTAAILLALGVPFLPLYAVSVDWGRWMSLHVFSAAILASCALLQGAAGFRRPPASGPVALLLALSLVAAPLHTVGLKTGGMLLQMASEF